MNKIWTGLHTFWTTGRIENPVQEAYFVEIRFNFVYHLRETSQVGIVSLNLIRRTREQQSHVRPDITYITIDFN